jgi:hypothetical protein
MYFNIMTLAACTAMTEREQTAIECRVWYLEVVLIQYALALVLISDTVPVCTNMGWEISGLRSADKYRSYKS